VQAETLLALGKRLSHRTWETLGHYGTGACLMWLGEFERGREHLAAAVELDGFTLEGGGVATWGDGDVRMSAHGYLHCCLSLLGRPDEANEVANSLFRAVAASTQPYARGIALSNICRIGVVQRDAAGVGRDAKRLSELAKTHNFPMLAALAMIYEGWAKSVSGEAVGGHELCSLGIAECQVSGVRIGLPANSDAIRPPIPI
jgi:hypothetical protein